MNLENKPVYKSFVEKLNKKDFHSINIKQNNIVEKLNNNNDNSLINKPIDNKTVEKINKSWDFKHNILIIRKTDYCIFSIILLFKNRIKVIHFSKYLSEEFISTVISYCLNLSGKGPIIFETSTWIYIHLPNSIKDYIILKHIRENKTEKIILDIKKYYIQGTSFIEIREKVMNKYKIRKISVKTIIKIAYIAYYQNIKAAKKWLRQFIINNKKQEISRYCSWTGKPPPLIINY